MPARQRTCDICNRWIKTNFNRHRNRCRRAKAEGPARKRRRVQEPLPKPNMEKVRGTRYLVAKTIKTTTLERLVTGSPIGMQGKASVTGSPIGMQGKHGGKASVTGSQTILRMMQVGIKKTWEEGLAEDLSRLSLGLPIGSQRGASH